MKLAWFRPAPLAPRSALDATAPLIAELGATHELHVYTKANAHDFVWADFRAPYGLGVFELDNTLSHAFVWPYLLHYGGVLLLHAPTLHDARARALMHSGRGDEYAAEVLFSEGRAPSRPSARVSTRPTTWPMLRAPLSAARVTVVPYRSLAAALREQYPALRIVYAPLGIELPERQRDAAVRPSVVTFGMLAGDRVDVATRALTRAQEAGAAAALLTDASTERLVRDADVVLVLSWPPHGGAQRVAYSAMAAGTPVVTLETVLTADWPALDPQTWQPRGTGADPPIAVTIDLRDEEHSLAVAIRRLSADAALRARLADAARAWSRAHESLPVAVAAWEGILQEAARVEPPARPPDWPRHLTADGTERARAMLAEFGVTVDLF